MKYENTKRAVFLDRPNRFIAHVDLNGQTETVHVKNTIFGCAYSERRQAGGRADPLSGRRL